MLQSCSQTSKDSRPMIIPSNDSLPIDASRITERHKKLASLFALVTIVNPHRDSRNDVAMLQNIMINYASNAEEHFSYIPWKVSIVITYDATLNVSVEFLGYYYKIIKLPNWFSVSYLCHKLFML